MLTPHGGAKPAFGVSTSTCILGVAIRGLCNAASVMNFPSPHLDALLKKHASILQFVLLPYNFPASLCHDERFANATLVQRDRIAYFLRQRARHMLLQVPVHAMTVKASSMPILKLPVMINTVRSVWFCNSSNSSQLSALVLFRSGAISTPTRRNRPDEHDNLCSPLVWAVQQV